MICPKCNAETNVCDSRRVEKGTIVRRRRECPNCGYRFRTYEITEVKKARYDLAVKFFAKYGQEGEPNG